MNLHECCSKLPFRKDQLVKDPYFDKVGYLFVAIIITKLCAVGKMLHTGTGGGHIHVECSYIYNLLIMVPMAIMAILKTFNFASL